METSISLQQLRIDQIILWLHYFYQFANCYATSLRSISFFGSLLLLLITRGNNLLSPMGAVGNIICWGVFPVLALVAAGYFQYQVNVQQLLDVGKPVYNHYPGPCRVVDGIVYGAEKITGIMFLVYSQIVFGGKFWVIFIYRTSMEPRLEISNRTLTDFLKLCS